MITKDHPTNLILWAELMENMVELVTNIVRERILEDKY